MDSQEKYKTTTTLESQDFIQTLTYTEIKFLQNIISGQSYVQI